MTCRNTLEQVGRQHATVHTPLGHYFQREHFLYLSQKLVYDDGMRHSLNSIK